MKYEELGVAVDFLFVVLLENGFTLYDKDKTDKAQNNVISWGVPRFMYTIDIIS